MEKNTSETPRNDREMEAYNPLRTHAVAFTGSMLLLLLPDIESRPLSEGASRSNLLSKVLQHPTIQLFESTYVRFDKQ
jgi:hypothetical protein